MDVESKDTLDHFVGTAKAALDEVVDRLVASLTQLDGWTATITVTLNKPK